MAVDDAQVTADRNAAIWYAQDAFDPAAMGMNGRRVAGQSFLDGFLAHAEVEEFVAVSQTRRGMQQFRELVRQKGRGRPARTVALDNLDPGTGISTVFHPSPTLAGEAWRRFSAGQAAFSICGVTHTTSTDTVMRHVLHLRTAPIEPWDAVICTSRAVQASVSWQLQQVDAYLERRFGYAPPPLPQLPVIPLGVNQSQLAAPPSAGPDLRRQLGLGPDTRVAMIMSRLSVNEKLDPLPIYQALQLAQEQFDGQMALILCGYFQHEFDERVFRDGAARLMPDVPLHVLDGRDEDVKLAAFAAADMFLFCIDNLQETFGIAPIEAMAAGLPLIVSDWDGLKDTVTPDVGFRVPTVLAEGHDRGRAEALRHVNRQDSYHRYLAHIAARTVIDVVAMAEKLLLLARDRDLARRMGEAGRQRVSRCYDWSAIIPQYQNLWEELSRMRRAAPAADGQRYRGLVLPIAPPPVDLFHSYPTRVGLPPATVVSAAHGDGAATEEAITALAALRQAPLDPRSLTAARRIWRHCHAAGEGRSLAQIASALSMRPAAAEQLTAWLLKYDFLRVLP